MIDFNNILAPVSDNKPEHRTVVRLQTSFWEDSRGCHMRKSLTYLKRKCIGCNILEEEVGAVGAETISNIEGFYDQPDGVYEVVVTNVSHDYESGIMDGWDLKLVEYNDRRL